MGRARIPLADQKGNITSIDKLKRQAEEKAVKTGTSQLTRPPDELIDDIAKKEWKRVVPQLKATGIIGNLDRANIIGYCNAYALYRRALRELVDGTAMAGQKERSDQIRFWQKEYRDYGKLSGMTYDSRLKAAAVQTKKEEDALEERFGGI